MSTKKPKCGMCLKCGNMNRRLDETHFCAGGCLSQNPKPRKPKVPVEAIYTTRQQIRERAEVLLEPKLNRIRAALEARIKEIETSEIRGRLWGDDAIEILVDDTIGEFE